MVTLGGVKTRLVEGKKNKKQAEDKFHELAAQRARLPECSSARVADVIEAFLAWSTVHRSEETNRNYLWYGQKFAEVVGYRGDIHWDQTKPDGMPRKLMDCSRMTALGWTPRIPLRDGLKAAYAWYRQQVGATPGLSL